MNGLGAKRLQDYAKLFGHLSAALVVPTIAQYRALQETGIAVPKNLDTVFFVLICY